MTYVSDKRLCLDADGNIVDCNSEAAATLLVGKGGEMTDEDARRYGLVRDEPKARAQSANKARAAAEDK